MKKATNSLFSGIYVSPECEVVETRFSDVLCVSDSFTIEDLSGNDWGVFDSEGGDF